MKVLFVTSEAHPLMKTGGLGDVCGSLPPALKALGVDVRLLLPAYRDAVKRAGRLKAVGRFALPGIDPPATLLEGALPGSRVKFWLLDHPPAYDRSGNPYHDAAGRPWPDNAARFALLARAAVAIAEGRAGVAWRPGIVHCHDWQSGLVPALLARTPARPATVFTVHNLAYQGLFPHDTFVALGLPLALWTFEALEFHGRISFIKGGLAFADRITTVSPTYAREIQTEQHGHGLEGLLRYRASVLHGILNGIDIKEWDPAHDAQLAKSYSARRRAGKAANKRALQRAFGLPASRAVPLIGLVSRLVPQKGTDLLLEALPALLRLPLQLAVLGSGEARFQQALQHAARHRADRLAVHIGYDEALAHRILGGADAFLMPSRFEPCGLTQLYSLRYGTVPIVRRVGGLADTVVDATEANLENGNATGIVFDSDGAKELIEAVHRALALYRAPRHWQRLQRAGMGQDFSWRHSAAEYRRLYAQCLAGAARPSDAEAN